MRKVTLVLLPMVVALSACDRMQGNQVERALNDVNVVDETNLNDVMLTVADPNEAVSYFQRASKGDPKRIDLQRGLAQSLIRAKRPTEAIPVWRKISTHPEATNDDRV
ncbi:MAG: tetratricopeptide repeat protein, partial [Pseudomonadota bacterium]